MTPSRSMPWCLLDIGDNPSFATWDRRYVSHCYGSPLLHDQLPHLIFRTWSIYQNKASRRWSNQNKDSFAIIEGSVRKKDHGLSVSLWLWVQALHVVLKAGRWRSVMKTGLIKVAVVLEMCALRKKNRSWWNICNGREKVKGCQANIDLPGYVWTEKNKTKTL